MSSLILELQRAALDSKISVTDLLRLAMVVAKKLKVTEFETWIKSELEGYGPESDVPAYRILSGQPVVFNPLRGWQTLFLTNLDPDLAEKIRSFKMNQPVAELEADLREQNISAIQVMYRPAQEKILMRMIHPPMQPAVSYQRSQFEGLLASVRNIILNWSLKLEEDGILGEGMSFSQEEKRVASNANYYIKNYIHEVSHSQVQQDTQHSQQTSIPQTLNVHEAIELVRMLRGRLGELNLDSPGQAELRAELKTIEAQAQSSKPKQSIIREALVSVRNILEGAAGSALGAGVVAQIGRLLG
jgi:hypothetical protein